MHNKSDYFDKIIEIMRHFRVELNVELKFWIEPNISMPSKMIPKLIPLNDSRWYRRRPKHFCLQRTFWSVDDVKGVVLGSFDDN